MWVIPEITPEFIERMEHVLDLYVKPYNPKEPVLCLDEKSKQLLENTKPVIPMRQGAERKADYEYKRCGTSNIFMAVEPKGGYRTAKVTHRRTKRDFAHEIRRIIDLPRYQNIKKLHIVLDNLNTHFEKSLYDTFSKQETRRVLSKVQFHYTPKHASWLNMAEIELSILGRQCLNRRIPDASMLTHHLRVWQARRNKHHSKINWRFTKQDARNTFKYNT